MQKKQIYIADTIHKTILLSNFEKEVISTQLFNRLHNISQNSTAYLTFPTNRTSRFEHSLGTMKLCGDIFYQSLCNTEEDVLEKFFNDFEESCINIIVDNTILSKTDATKSDMYRGILGDTNLEEDILKNYCSFEICSSFYNNYVPLNISKDNLFLYLLLFQAIRLCGLLHDIGHPPFSHITENALTSVYHEIKHKENKTTREQNYVKILESYGLDEKDAQLHEIMGNKMTERMISDLIFSNNDWQVDMSFENKYFKILVYEVVKHIFKEETHFCQDIHRIIDGVIDGDRLDYVSRDLVNSGIDQGIIEYSRLISSMKLFRDDPLKNKEFRYMFLADVKTISTVEDFFFKRWNLYKNIIYHHRVIKTDSLLGNCIKNIVIDYLKVEGQTEEVINSRVLPYDISGLWMAIKIANSNTRYFNSLIQWDDGWLMAVLKKYYFEIYYDEIDNLIKHQLEELLSNKKYYYSLIKNKSDFDILEDSLFENLKEIEFEGKIIPLDDLPNYNKIANKQNLNSMIFRLEAYSQLIGDQNYNVFLIEQTSRFIEDNYKDSIEHSLIINKKIKTGLTPEPHLYKINDMILISKVSTLKKRLEEDCISIPFFFIYLKFKNPQESIKKKDFYKEFLTELGSYLADKTKVFLNNILEGAK
jgi:hypothetical protein